MFTLLFAHVCHTLQLSITALYGTLGKGQIHVKSKMAQIHYEMHACMHNHYGHFYNLGTFYVPAVTVGFICCVPMLR